MFHNLLFMASLFAQIPIASYSSARLKLEVSTPSSDI